MMMNNQTIKNLTMGAALLCLVACQTVPSEYSNGDPVKPLTTQERIQSAMRDAAIETQKGRVVAGALKVSEAAYKAAPNNGELALNYAHDLRLAGLGEQAQMVLRPFAINPKKSNEDILVEYAKVKLQDGDFEGAQIYAQEAMMLNPKSAQAHHVLGIAVDAQGHHQASENHYRNSLNLLVDNDPLRAAIQNNLALSLAAQGKSVEAQSLLSTSKTDAPLARGTIQANKAFLNAL
jgi:Flp pilus assembly protein TadD